MNKHNSTEFIGAYVDFLQNVKPANDKKEELKSQLKTKVRMAHMKYKLNDSTRNTCGNSPKRRSTTPNSKGSVDDDNLIDLKEEPLHLGEEVEYNETKPILPILNHSNIEQSAVGTILKATPIKPATKCKETMKHPPGTKTEIDNLMVNKSGVVEITKKKLLVVDKNPEVQVYEIIIDNPPPVECLNVEGPFENNAGDDQCHILGDKQLQFDQNLESNMRNHTALNGKNFCVNGNSSSVISHIGEGSKISFTNSSNPNKTSEFGDEAAIRTDKWLASRWNRGVYNKMFCAIPKTSEQVFFQFLRILPHQYDIIYNLISPTLWSVNSKRFTSLQFIHPQVELAITISYLTQGYNFEKLAHDYRVDIRAILITILKVTRILVNCLEPLYLTHQLDNWNKISNDFWEKLEFPHTVGSVHGKILRSSNSSIMLVASCDLNNNFLWSAVYKTDTVKANKLHLMHELKHKVGCLPHTSVNSNLNMPHFFVGSKRMPLLSSLMTPYKGSQLSFRQMNFNHRAAEITKSAQKSFDLLAHRFWFYKQNNPCSVATVQMTIRATISMYNFLRQTGSDISCPKKVQSKLENISKDFAHLVCDEAVLNRDTLSQFLDPSKQDVILMDKDDADVIVIE